MPETAEESPLIGTLLFEIAGKGSAVLDTFSGWLLGGFGAAVTFLIGKLDAIPKHLPVETVRYCTFLFLIAAVLGLFEKYLATFIAAGAQGAAIGRELGKEEAPLGQPEVIFRELRRAILPPMRWFIDRSLRKRKSGDRYAAPRNFVRCAQVQGLFVLVEVVIVLLAVYAIAHSLVI